MQLKTNDPIVSPVDSADFINWARLDSDDPTVAPLLISATAIVISFLKQDLINREWTLTHQDWPIAGTAAWPSISRQTYRVKARIDLPYAMLQSVTSVKVNGELSTDYDTIKGKPDQLEFDDYSVSDGDNPALEVVYTAGFGETADDVPDEIKNAIMMVGTYLHSHNGMCDYGDAVKMSGAAALLTPYAVCGGMVL